MKDQRKCRDRKAAKSRVGRGHRSVRAKPVAKKLKGLSGFTGDAAIYELSPPLKEGRKKFRFVAVSATYAMFSGPETYIFGADKNGKVTHWGELPGSFKGALDHAAALEGAGYRVQP